MRSYPVLFSIVLPLLALTACTPPTAEEPSDSGPLRHAWGHYKPHGPWPPVSFPDASAPPDLAPPPPPPADAGAIADLASPPDLTQIVDMAKGDMAQVPFVPSGMGIRPSSGPAGTMITVTGSGFQNGDVVVISGPNLPLTPLATMSLAASAIVAVVPALNVMKPAGLQIRVQRAMAVNPPEGLPFNYTAGRIFYIATNGSDNNPGTLQQPWRTIGGASGKMAAGDVAYLRDGTYNGQVRIDASGNASAPITFTAYPGESPLIRLPATNNSALDTIRVYGAYVTLDGLRVTDDNNPGQAIWLSGTSHHVTITNCEVFGSHGQGILITGDNSTVYRNHIHHNGAHTPFDHGIYIEGGGNIIRSNVIHDNWTFGIQLYNGGGGQKAGNLIEFNYVYHNGFNSNAQDANAPNAGIVIASAHPNSVIRNNIFCANAQYGIYLIDGQSGTQMTGNVSCYNARGGLFMRYPGSGTVLSRNISYNDSSFALSSSNGVTSDFDSFFRSGGQPSLRWNGNSYDLAGFRNASGQEKNGQVADPQFKGVPANGFDVNAAPGYDFCTQLNPALCTPRP